MLRKFVFLLVAALIAMPAFSLAQQEPVQMNNMRVTDLSVATAFVSWTTDQKTRDNKIEVIAPDSTYFVSAGYIGESYTHLVQIIGLQIDTEYGFRVISNDNIWDSDGENFKFTTLDDSQADAPKTVWGELQDSWGNPIKRCLVRYWLQNEFDGTSLPKVVLSDDDGVWIGDAGIMYNASGTGLFKKYGADRIILELVPNYWTNVADSTNQLGFGQTDLGTISIQVIDPNASVPGDVDGNGALNIFDVLDLLKVIGGKVEGNAASDVDGNGKVDIFDLLALLRKLSPSSNSSS